MISLYKNKSDIQNYSNYRGYQAAKSYYGDSPEDNEAQDVKGCADYREPI